MKFRKFPDRPFVGFLGERNEIEVLERSGKLVCRSLRGIVVFKQVILLLFGGGLTAGLWFSLTHPAIAPTPTFWAIFMAVFAVVCWLVFFRNLVGTPWFVVSGATGEVAMFRRRTAEPWKKIPAQEISHFTIEKQIYWDDDRETENAVLLLFTTTGERRVMCGSPDRQLIAGLAEKMGRLTQRKVVATPAAG